MINLTHTHLIKTILQELNLSKDNVTEKSTPMSSSNILTENSESTPFHGHFNYRKVVCKWLLGLPAGRMVGRLWVRFPDEPSSYHDS